MILPYTPAQAEAAHNDWKARCGHFSIAAASGCPLEEIRTAGVPLKGWMNPTMISQTLTALKFHFDRFLLKERGYDSPEQILALDNINQGSVLRVQWEGSWMDAGVPAGARYSRTHYIACKGHTIMDPAFDPKFPVRVQDWLQIAPTQIVPLIKGATGYHFTHAWVITPKETLAPFHP
ncbi:MAG: hypothetical protein J0L73_28520 [Verrucomicrobia bacterium]|nr:hypothetical protein [Verrucomicrobiota bacterium]